MASNKLSGSMGKDRASLRDAAAQVFTALNQANDSLKDIEDAYNVQSLEKIMPNEKAPVRGTEDMDRDTGKSPSESPLPGTSRGKTEMNPNKTTVPDTTNPNTPPVPEKKPIDQSKVPDPNKTPKSPNY